VNATKVKYFGQALGLAASMIAFFLIALWATLLGAHAQHALAGNTAHSHSAALRADVR
jgi:hypothetical protein